MTVQEMERKVITRLLQDAIAQGYSVSVDNGEEVVVKKSTDVEEIMKAMFSVDEEYLHFFKNNQKVGWACLIYGESGWDVINDYSMNLEPIMEGVFQLVDQLCH